MSAAAITRELYQETFYNYQDSTCGVLQVLHSKNGHSEGNAEDGDNRSPAETLRGMRVLSITCSYCGGALRAETDSVWTRTYCLMCGREKPCNKGELLQGF